MVGNQIGKSKLLCGLKLMAVQVLMFLFHGICFLLKRRFPSSFSRLISWGILYLSCMSRLVNMLFLFLSNATALDHHLFSLITPAGQGIPSILLQHRSSNASRNRNVLVCANYHCSSFVSVDLHTVYNEPSVSVGH